MEKKYYDLIITLIKQHRKYPGCEDIIDEIANDVYSHSEVVLGTISNEDVINSYLNKVISTSIVTIPKKLNINTRTKSNKTLEDIVLPIAYEQSESAKEVVNKEEENDDTLAEIIEEDFERIPENNETADLEVSLETNALNDGFEEDEAESEETDGFETIDEVLNIEEIDIIDAIEPKEIDNIEDTVNMTLVEKMINGVPKEEEELITELDSNDNIIEETLAIEEKDEKEVEELDMIDNVEDSADILEESSEIYDSLDSVELVEETRTSEDEAADFSSEIEGLEFENDVVELTNETEEFEIKDEISELIDDVQKVEIPDVVEEVESNLDKAVYDDSKNEDLSSPSYDCFAFNPEEIDIDNSLILSELQFINEKYPDNLVFKICDLKYKQNLSVSDICEKTEIPETEVINILSEIINAVKD